MLHSCCPIVICVTLHSEAQSDRDSSVLADVANVCPCSPR